MTASCALVASRDRVAAFQMSARLLHALNGDLIEHLDQLRGLGGENTAFQIFALGLLHWIGALHEVHIANAKPVLKLFAGGLPGRTVLPDLRLPPNRGISPRIIRY